MLERGWRWTSRVRSRAVVGTIGRRFAGKVSIAGGGFSASESARLSVLLVVVALIFCHGAFGYAHQLPPADALVEPATYAEHMGGGHQPGHDQSTDGMHSGGAYFATLLVLFFGTTLLLGGGVPASTRLPAPVAEHRGRWVKILLPPRGPTLPSLQVFRL